MAASSVSCGAQPGAHLFLGTGCAGLVVNDGKAAVGTLLDAVGDADSVNSRLPIGNSARREFPRATWRYRRGARHPRLRTIARCAGSAATRTRALRDNRKAVRRISRQREQFLHRIVRRARGKVFGVVADRGMNDGAAVARAGGVSTASSGNSFSTCLA